ncbi:MAG: acyl-CoA dehydrogenase family protein [Cypionkella sp.]
MTELLLSRRNLAFTLYELLDVEALSALPRFASHDRASYDAVLDLYETIATEHFQPHAAASDAAEPQFDGDVVTVHPAIAPALAAFSESGLMAATRTEEEGGIALPHAVERAGVAYLMAANPATAGYPFLTIANLNLLSAHADAEVVARYVPAMLEGRFFGTMCLSEPQAGSSLGDIRTRAVPMADGRYRLFGNKMWISAGEHPLADNIIHAVLAKTADQDGKLTPGTRGISLFVVPRTLVEADGSLGERSTVR